LLIASTPAFASHPLPPTQVEIVNGQLCIYLIWALYLFELVHLAASKSSLLRSFTCHVHRHVHLLVVHRIDQSSAVMRHSWHVYFDWYKFSKVSSTGI